MYQILLNLFGCIPLDKNNDTSLFGYLDLCSPQFDMSNTGSAWFGAILGLIIGVALGVLIYERQKKTSDKQDKVLRDIEKLEKKHEIILKKILALDEKIDSILEKK